MEMGPKNIRLTSNAASMRALLSEDKWFTHPSKVYAFAVGVHLKEYKKGEIVEIGPLDKTTGLASSTFDPNGDLETLVKIYNPSANTVNDTLENWINSGLHIMYKKYSSSSSFDLSEYF